VDILGIAMSLASIAARRGDEKGRRRNRDQLRLQQGLEKWGKPKANCFQTNEVGVAESRQKQIQDFVDI
jgi:hypothetical protein